MKKLKLVYLKVKNVFRLLKKERSGKLHTSLFTKLFCYKNGFLSEASVIYDFRKNNPKAYISDYFRFMKIPFINTQFSYILDNKLMFELYFEKQFEVIKSEGLLHITQLFSKEGRQNAVNSILNILTLGFDCVVKPISGGGGYGILFIEKRDQEYFLNNRQITLVDLSNTINKLKNYICYRRFSQKGFSNKIYSKSLNTIRVLTMISPVTNEPFIAIAVHRFGTSQSGNVDNWSSGGICSEIDIETGALSKAVGYPITGKLEWHVKHPDSGVKIEGEIVPNWDSVKLFVLQAARNVAMIPYIGWDIVLSDDEIYILEANSNSDVNLLQVHRPLLSVPEVKEFYKYHRVL